MGWHLQDVEEENRRHPRSFLIPPVDERRSLRLEQQVKLVLIPEQPASHGAERMWVTVTDTKAKDRYVGVLDNDPVVVSELKAGDLIEFGPEHVAAVQSHKPVGYPAAKKALVNRRIVEEDLAPKVLIFEQPANPSDSGWTLLLGSETPAEMSDRAMFLGPNLGWLAERYPRIVPCLEAAVPGVFVWDDARQVYRFDGSPAK